MAQPATTPQQKLAALEAILATVSRTRSSLPALVKTVLPDSPLPLVPQSATDRATAYRTASTECHAAIRVLADQLEAVEVILAETDQSEQRDRTDIVVRPVAANDDGEPRKKQVADENKPTWTRVGEILAAGGTTAQLRASEPYKPVHAVPTTSEELEGLLEHWNEAHQRVRIVVTQRQAGRPTELQLTLRGVLRARVALRWVTGNSEGADRCEADYITCYALKEEVRERFPCCVRFSALLYVRN